MNTIWLAQTLVAHLFSDFLLQPASWVQHRQRWGFRSSRLYAHGLTTLAMAWVCTGFPLQATAVTSLLFLGLSHTIIDGFKSWFPANTQTFLIDQFLHLLILVALSIFMGSSFKAQWELWSKAWNNSNVWWYLAAYLWIGFPAGMVVGMVTATWRNTIPNAESLAQAGKWIGILERMILLTLVIDHQFGALGLLVAAKGLLRFSDKPNPLYARNHPMEAKTEYLLIGSLLSIALALFTGIALLQLTD
jgi:hypothetical protein